MEFYDVIKTRTSVRKYSPEPVEDEKIHQILECARLAPSWANKQCWSFVVIRDPSMIKAVSRGGGLTNNWIKNVPVIILACGDPQNSGTRAGIEYFAVDVAIAMEHLVLAAADLGLGTCWIGYFKEDKIKEIMGIPDYIRVVALTPLGYPSEKPGFRDDVFKLMMSSKNRRALEDIVHYDRW